MVRPVTDAVLRPGDVLRINVWRHPELSGEFVVATDSSLVHPVYQVVKVAGVPVGVVKERLRVLLTAYEQDAHLAIEPLFSVSVEGEVRQPNLYRLAQGTTIAQAIALAGGPTETGRLDKVHLIRRDGEIAVDLAGGYSRFEGLPVLSGDQVVVGRRSGFNFVRDIVVPVASLTGAVAAIIYASRR
jgi:polysaccharide export outer membrane protein